MRKAFLRFRRVILQCPTGGGKTACAAEIIRLALTRQKKVVFIAHLDALVSDTHERLVKSGISASIVQAGFTYTESAVSVCSLQTLLARNLAPFADLVIFDECHRANAERTKELLARYENALILGLTATPQRSDGTPLCDTFEHLEIGPSVKTLTNDGFLVPSHVVAPGLSLASSEAAMSPVEAYEKFTPTANAVVFCRDLSHVADVWAAFAVAGYHAETITGETAAKDRKAIISRVKQGETKILVGCNVFTEGFDCPPIDCVILARKIGFIGQWLQAIGRGLRPSHDTGKTRCTVLDLHGSVHDHGLPDSAIDWRIDQPPKQKNEPLRRCPRCEAVFEPAPSCPRCGHEFGVEKGKKDTAILGLDMHVFASKQGPNDVAAIQRIAFSLRGSRTMAQKIAIARSIYQKRIGAKK